MHKPKTDLYQVTVASGGIARSPSRDSFATEFSLMSLSSLGSDMSKTGHSVLKLSKHEERTDDHSPQPNKLIWSKTGFGTSHCPQRNFLQVPHEHYGGRSRDTITEVLFEDESEIIRNCGALSSVFGLMKSFSTSDITHITNIEKEPLRRSSSEVAACDWSKYEMQNARLGRASRSLSTWVAVGDVVSTSQLPSPQPFLGPHEESPSITATDFVRSINKKARQMYIQQRVSSTYKALERLTRSQLDLNTDLPEAGIKITIPQVQVSSELDWNICNNEVGISGVGLKGSNKSFSLTAKDIERDRGKPLTRYERNMMIFNWLHNVNENAFELS
ncbi:uncharacterized protein LOC106469737 [Limulus polyphemus]|uniref:Uncharacterized protein LOC106469737 n=1 Tax=Limulus polyphemus TaxID=6850 RepID=A0ABM1TDP6_LIMPO|nr:uncharacterized protein LOC106469737 [Limulus polyphemus]